MNSYPTNSKELMKIALILKTCLILVPQVLALPLLAQRAEKADTVVVDPETAAVQIGYGTLPAQHVTGAISTVQGISLEKNFTLNLGNTLYGRLPGLTVAQGGSEPGASTPNLFVRGVNTIGGASTAPLYVIDGFISNGNGPSNAFMQLMPEEIESVAVLKDASATAIYGARAANGVILITTKAGRNGPLQVSFTTKQGFNQAQYLPKFLDSYEYASLFNEALRNDGLAERYSQADLDAYRTGSDPYFHPNVNWYDQILRKIAPVSSYNLNFSGGDNYVRYYVMLNALSSQGLFQKFGDQNEESSNSKYSKYNFRTNLDINLTSRLSAQFKIAGSLEQSTNPNNYTTAGTFGLLASLPPNAFPVYNPDGSFGGSSLYANPVGNMLATGFYKNNSRTILSSLKLTEQLDMLTPGLSVSAAVSINNYFESGSQKSKQYPRFAISKNNAGETVYGPAIGQLTSLAGSEITLDQYRNLIFLGSLDYKRTFGKSDISGMLLFSSDNVTLFGSSAEPGTPSANSTDPYKHNAASGRLSYVYNNKYIAGFSASYMGSESFPPGKRYGFFPAASLGWIASGEGFMKNVKAIDFLKFRGSYGLTGNDVIAGLGLSGRYAYMPTFGGAGYFFGTGNNGAAGFAETNIANPNLTWEKEKMLNLGADATIFRQLDIAFDYFKRDRYDILVASNSTMPQFTGIPTPNLNQGKTRSSGFELALRFNSKKDAAIAYFLEGNVSYFKNKIIFNAEALQFNKELYATGRQIGQPLGLKAIGFYTQEDIEKRLNDPKSVPGVLTEVIRAGDIKYQDAGGADGKPDGIIDGNDRVAIGNPGLPNFTAGLHGGLRYKGFDLDLVFQGVSGNTVYLGGSYFHAFQANGQIAPIAQGRWTEQTAGSATYPRLSSKDNLNNYQFSSFWQRNGSFVKLRSAEIGYTLPTPVSDKLRLETIRFFVNGTNLFSWDKVPYGDPESLAGYPVTRTVTAGFRVQL